MLGAIVVASAGAGQEAVASLVIENDGGAYRLGDMPIDSLADAASRAKSAARHHEDAADR